MSKEVVKMVEERRMPWLRVEKGRVSDESKRAIDEVFLALGGRIFFTRVEPMKSRSYFPRRGYGEFVSELVSFARMAQALAEVWKGEGAVVDLAAQVRTVYGFGGKGCRAQVSLELERVRIINNINVFSGLYSCPGPSQITKTLTTNGYSCCIE